VDGTRDRPPGKTAENWSRKDGIRGGAVSGPWRSGPRAPGAAPEAAPVAAERAPAARLRPAAWAGGWKPGMRARVGFGALAAVAVVVAAVGFWPTQPEEPQAVAEAPAPEPAIAPAPAPAPVAAPEPAAAPPVAAPAPAVEAAAAARAPDPALAGVTSVRLRVGPDFPAERQAAILAALAEAGIAGVEVEPLTFEVAASRVGYYRAADLAAAEALGRVVAPVIAPGGEVRVRDYGALLADAEPGRLDLWVGG
jgi:hypothetical protein